MSDSDEARRIREGDARTATRLIRKLEDHVPEARATIRQIFPHTGKAHVIGLTGSPGAGKSTLVDALIEVYRKKGKTVGVLAVDPTSPFTGGAVLGDRIRMLRHTEDEQVFIRSLATRGARGGLSQAVGDAVHVLDAMGKDVIMVETVGAGQQEVDIVNHSHTVIVVLTPGMGDEVQAMKAGIMEIADIFVINKADRDGTEQLYAMLMAMLQLVSEFPGGWRPPVVKVANVFDVIPFREKVEELVQNIGEHHRCLVSTRLLEDRIRRTTGVEINEALYAYLLEPLLRSLAGDGELDRMVQRIIARQCDAYTAVEEAAAPYLKKYVAELEHKQRRQ